MWKPFDELTVRWRPEDGQGIEHLQLRKGDHGLSARSHVIGENEGRLFSFTYQIDLDSDWRVLGFTVDSIDARSRSYRSPAPGRWQDGDGNPLPRFDGCLDIDLSFTCFTNSLPVHRLAFAKGEAREFSMLWMPSDTLDPFVDGQRYTCLEPGRRFRYEATDGSFEAEIEFDDHGLVTNYPGLFRRVS